MQLGALATVFGQFFFFCLAPRRGDLLFDISAFFTFLGFYSVTSDFVALAIERLFASVFNTSYEHRKNVFLLITLFIFTLTIFCYMTYYQIYNTSEKIRFLIQLTCLFIASSLITSLIILRLIEIWNKQRYGVAIQNKKSYTLSQRFQLIENIKMTRGLRNGIQIFVIVGCITAVFYAVGYATYNGTYGELFFGYRSLAITVINIGFSISFYVTINSNNLWKKDINVTYDDVRKLLSSSKVDEQQTSALKQNINGKEMIFDVIQSTDLHFQQLRSSWEDE
ncbi:unnamed protein product [Bursaphelenchus okinawaensis]|uniref:Uncharacterized protein n=1 Tax=Bursaphelenchus okinawaensis TaxID=465554 RepID=A0A811L853_9BILA|nr:unnamed protein product [Bursaphelenchus okinawaensis]CAG9120895.1 unnamed protein product [Bursaphelenchus okinawaensis]